MGFAITFLAQAMFSIHLVSTSCLQWGASEETKLQLMGNFRPGCCQKGKLRDIHSLRNSYYKLFQQWLCTPVKKALPLDLSFC